MENVRWLQQNRCPYLLTDQLRCWVSAKTWCIVSGAQRVRGVTLLERVHGSKDPDFERKAADIIGVYLNPPRHAAVFCVDEKSAIQAMDRLDPVLPMSPGRA